MRPLRKFTPLALAVVALSFARIAQPATPDPALVEQGRYLATAGDCVACHTRPGGPAFAGGRTLETPFGVIYSANITPESATGIGAWTEAEFVQALREGLGRDGRHLYPAFPYTAYTRISDADAHAIFAYLRALPAVRYTPPPNRMKFPFGIRSLLAGWKALYFDATRFRPDPRQSTEWNRGAYLVQGLGHCGACHTPRNAFGAERTDQALSGGVLLGEIDDEVVEGKITPMDERTVRRWSAANLTGARSGLAAWSVADIVAYLRSGHSTRAGAFGPMGEVIANSTSKLSDPDLPAMAVYLKSLPVAGEGRQSEANAARLVAGENVYTTRCADCHLPTGRGVPQIAGAPAGKTAPPLVGNAALQAPDPATLVNVILYGAHEARPNDRTWPVMSGFELSVGLDDEQIAALCTYLRRAWGNDAGAVDAADVARQR